jgi:hypothetical protein
MLPAALILKCFVTTATNLFREQSTKPLILTGAAHGIGENPAKAAL